MSCGIYKIRNIVIEKVYVGHSQNIENRWWEHRISLRKGDHHNRHLQSSFVKYGEESFEFSILEECSIDQLSSREQIWADDFRSKGIELYNQGDYLDSPVRGSHPVRSDEWRQNHSKTMTGRSHSEETKQKIRSQKHGPRSEEWLRKQREAKSGRQQPTRSESHLQHLKEANNDLEKRQRHSEFMKNLHAQRRLKKQLESETN